MLALIERAHQEWGDFDLYFLGDLIDRGPDSRSVVEYAMKNKIPTVMGNHEDLCLAYSRHGQLGYKSKCGQYYDRNVWLYNGGDKALKSWDLHGGSGFLPRTVLNWMQNLPPYIIPDTVPDENGRKLLLSHTGYGLDADKNTPADWMYAIWGRRRGGDVFIPDGNGGEKDDGFFRVFGHTQEEKPWMTDKFAMIDTGCAYKASGLGNLTAFHWPTKQIVSVACID